MIRVTTGTAKNKTLDTPDISGFRAVQDVAKLAIFSILGDMVLEAECLDLFAGSGSLGIEALSQGASYCDFVDSSPKAIRTIQNNLQETSFTEKADTVKQEAAKFAANTANSYDVIFLDPFYKDTKHKYLMENLQEIINPNGTVVLLHGQNLDLDDLLQNTRFFIADQRKYGKSYATFLKLAPTNPEVDKNS
jgi:16S rRNA (guanine966-N2)-methyltransferase